MKQNRDSEDSQSEFLGTISADAVNSSKPWTAMLKLNNRALEFKVDTGADVTVVPESAYNPTEDGSWSKTAFP